jgi:hypothetical protein
MDGLLTFEHGEIRLGDTLVPGVLQRLSVGGRVRYDEAQQDGLSGKTKTPMGWEDSEVSISLLLLTDDDSDCFDKLAELNRLFKGHDNAANPRVLRVANPHLAARDVDQVVFDSLDSSEGNDDDTVEATLRFMEHRPPIQISEQRATSVAGTAPTSSTATEPGLSPSILGGR